MSYRLGSENDWPVEPLKHVDNIRTGLSYFFFGPKELAALTPPFGGLRGESGRITMRGSQNFGRSAYRTKFGLQDQVESETDWPVGP